MGAAASLAIVTNTVKSLTSYVNTTVSSVIQDSDTTCNAVNTFQGYQGIYPSAFTNGQVTATQNCPITVGGDGYQFSQNANNTCSLKGELTSDINSTITSNLTNNIDQWLTANAKANNGFLGFGVSIAISEGKNQIWLADKISNAITSNLAQTCAAGLEASNLGILYFCGDYPDGIKIVQNAFNTNLTSCIINNVINNVQNDTELNGIVQKAIVKASAANEGIFSGLKWIILAIAILAVVIVIGLVLYFVFGSKSKPAEQEKPMLNPEEREILTECVEGTKRKLESEGRPLSPEVAEPMVKACVFEKKTRLEREQRAEMERGSERRDGYGSERRRDEDGYGRRDEGGYGSERRDEGERRDGGGYGRRDEGGYGGERRNEERYSEV